MNNLLGKIIELKIDSIANGGNGIGRFEGIACFVPGVISGETVKAKIVTEKKKYLIAEPIELLKASSLRIPTECPFALGTENFGKDFCPGCQYQHIPYDEEIKVKTNQFKDLLERFAKINPDLVLKETVPSAKTINYRNKITLHTNKAKNRIGYFKENGKGILHLNKCPLAHGEINKKLKHFDLSIPIVQNASEIVFRYTPKDSVLVYTDKTANDLMIEEKTSIGNFQVPLKSFFQINIYAREKLLEKAIETLKSNHTDFVFDLYCGVGFFAIAAAKSGAKKVFAADIDRKAVNSAKINAEIHNTANIKFLPLPAISAAKSILSTLSSDKTTVVLDPPRTGLDTQMIQYLIKLKPANILYISCGPDTLCRDLKIFSEGGYKLKETQIIDMFPRTAHFETISLLNI